MPGRAFLDTNVLVYADDVGAGDRRERAMACLERHLRDRSAVFSTQVLQEYFVVATRKLGLSPARARRKVELLATQDVVTLETDAVLAAIDLHRLHALSFWDALIVQAAATARCKTLITEDLQEGQVLQGVRIARF